MRKLFLSVSVLLSLSSFSNELAQARLRRGYLTPEERSRGAQACLQEACDRLGPLGCRKKNTHEALLFSCQGNYGASCLITVCSYLGPLGCRHKEELMYLAQGCRGNFDGSCVASVCSRLDRFECDEAQEVGRIAYQCAGGV